MERFDLQLTGDDNVVVERSFLSERDRAVLDGNAQVLMVGDESVVGEGGADERHAEAQGVTPLRSASISHQPHHTTLPPVHRSGKGTALQHAGKLEEQELLKAFQDIASALSFLHGLDNYILHQDIKPDNFLIDDQGNYLLADFGISKKLKRSLTKSVVNNRKTELISDSKNSGTTPPAYRPPETFDTDFEKRKPIKASDIWLKQNV